MSKKSKPTISSHRKELIKLIEKAARTTSTWNVFNDFITVSALSLSNSSDSFHIANNEEVWNQREQRYLKTINKYDEDTRPLFPKMFAELVAELQNAATSHYTDVLGKIFHELEFHNKWTGQFFTPQHISDLMALMTIDSDTTAKNIEERGFITINEPCCGAGSLVIGAINAMREIKLNPSKQMLVVANDIDERCVMMCYIQLSLYGVPAVITQQNTITMQTYGSPWYTPVFIFDGWTWRFNRAFSQGNTKTKEAEVVPTTEDSPNEPLDVSSEDVKVEPFGQLSLF